MDVLGDGLTDGAAAQRVDDWSAGIAARAAAAQALSERVAGLSVSVSGTGGSVEVTVGGSGVPTDIRLTDRVLRWSPDQIAAEILAVMRRAQGLLASRVAQEAAGTVGADSETARAVVSSFARRFPVAPDENDSPDGTPTRW